jgi:hypothetical protein
MLWTYGLCVECQRYRNVRATGSALLSASYRSRAVEGVCRECEAG